MTGTSRRYGAAALAAAVAVGFFGCEESSAVKPPSSRAIEAWKAAGMEVPAFEPMAGAGIGGGECVSGVMQGLETVVCTYPNAEAARSARSAGLSYVGETTGVSLPAGVALLVVADRARSDPSGKAINEVAKVFLAGMADAPAGAAKGGEDEAGEGKAGGDEAGEGKAGEDKASGDKASGDKAGGKG